MSSSATAECGFTFLPLNIHGNQRWHNLFVNSYNSFWPGQIVG